MSVAPNLSVKASIETKSLTVTYEHNALKQRFEYADSRMPVAMIQNGQKYYLHYDQVGSLRAVSDSSHTIVKEIVYDTYGTILTDSNPSFTIPFGFAGGMYDADTKLTRFGYRDYDAYTGKWTAKDPIGFDGGDSNLYGYVLGDPVGFVDPSGLSDVDLLDDNSFSDWALDYLPWNNPDDRITVGGHGGKGDNNAHLGFKWKPKDIQKIIDDIKKLDKYKKNPNIPIEIDACYVGETNIPQMIANGTGRDVTAYGGTYIPGYGIGFYPRTFYPIVDSGKK